MNWLRKFMVGRYGRDQLSMALLILSFIIILIADLTRLPLMVFVSYIPAGICIFRVLSRNISKRRMENNKFSMLISPVYSWLKKVQNRAKNAKARRYYKCPNCKAGLWVPKGKGKIIITCPKCKTEFRKRT